MATDVSNAADVIDSRDVIARIEELRAEREELADDPDALAEWEEGDGEEFKALLKLADEGETLSDWEYGEALIRESYFAEYCRQLVSDIGDLPKDIPGYLVIDWDATADNLRADYTSLDYDGVTYLARS